MERIELTLARARPCTRRTYVWICDWVDQHADKDSNGTLYIRNVYFGLNTLGRFIITVAYTKTKNVLKITIDNTQFLVISQQISTLLSLDFALIY